MRKVTLSCAVVLGLVGAAAALGVGCSSGDDDQFTDAPDAATDAVSDTGKHDATGDSSHPVTDSGHDTGVDSSGDDDGSIDSGTDTGVDSGTDAGTDSGSDTGTDAGHDAGTDAGSDTGTDSGTDASDAGPTDSGTDGTIDDGGLDANLDASVDADIDAADSETPYTFANPLQIDVSSVLDVNTIANVSTVDAGALTPVDGSGYDFLTAAKGAAIGGCTGLPDTAFFAANGTIHPGVQLHWSATSPAPNSHVAFPATSFTFPVPAARYTQFQLYGISTEGSSKLTITITYADATTNGGKTATFNDWFQGAAGGQFVLANGFGRIGSGGNCDSNGSISLSGVNVIPDPNKVVTQIMVLNTGTGRFVFLGASAF